MTRPRTGWMADALCAEPAHVDLPWFPRRGQPIDDRCLAVCADCAVRDACLDHAVEHLIDEGVWGGTSPRERRRIRRRRRLNASPPATGAGSGAGGG